MIKAYLHIWSTKYGFNFLTIKSNALKLDFILAYDNGMYDLVATVFYCLNVVVGRHFNNLTIIHTPKGVLDDFVMCF